MAIKDIKPKPLPTHAFKLAEVTFDPSWFEALRLRGITPADLPTTNNERQAYIDYLTNLQVISFKNDNIQTT